jgi:sorting nexin-5/6/32
MIRRSETLLTLLCLELVEFKQRRVVAFKKNLIEVAELEVKHAKVSFKVLQRFY